MDMQEDIMPMDAMEDSAPPPPVDQQPADDQQQAKQDRARDEAGRFAPKPDGPKGAPNDEIARRRYAQERDEARNAAAEAQAKYEALQKRLDDMAALAKGDDPNAPKQPVDPLAPVLDKLNGLESRFAEEDKAKQEAAAHQQVMTYAEQDEARFRQKTPDFPQATEHYIRSRLTEMQALGVDQAQAEQVLAQEARALLYQCAQSGKSPAEAIYALARARGYAPGASSVPQPNPPPQPNFGGRSMGTGGGPAGGAMTAAQIAAMDEADYMAFRATPEGRRTIQRLMGG